MTELTLHPNRYPKHKDKTKGQMHNGICNTTACDRPGAIYWNSMTHGFYCRHCADGINFKDYICKPVEGKPDLIEMDEIHRKACKEFCS
ncbi:hypothetical protein PXK56_18230 [Phaeobacter gallaeciensis]|uniref:hypothetical protein n=1 Tax=Phaeobacter gallaeciensis TaxID=60890 RepID=UPI0023802E0B|nr:hypothetical protein [Phaeobacter gallaeciensis]MDE4297125.1 hypothetical protein [Phaeobacter gallaeciensis]